MIIMANPHFIAFVNLDIGIFWGYLNFPCISNVLPVFISFIRKVVLCLCLNNVLYVLGETFIKCMIKMLHLFLVNEVWNMWYAMILWISNYPILTHLFLIGIDFWLNVLIRKCFLLVLTAIEVNFVVILVILGKRDVRN